MKPGRAQKFWQARQRRARPGGLTGYLLDESPPSVGARRFQGEWRQLAPWIKGARGAALDVGCGTGIWLAALARRFESAEGWDYAPAMVAASRRTLRAAGIRNARLHCGEITRRKGAACFDLIFVGGVLMYTPDRALPPLLAALRRLLKPGGQLVLRESAVEGKTWERAGLPLRPGLLADARQKKGLDYVAIYRSRETLRLALESAGFKVKALRPNPHYKLSDLTEDWLRRLRVGADPGRAEAAARWIYRLRFALLYPEYYLRKWKLNNYWFLASA